MRIVTRTLLAAFSVCFGFSGQASAKVKVVEKTGHYQINGNTGLALLQAMDRHGPRHGFLTRAIAQTKYSVVWNIEFAETAKVCRVKRVNGELAVTYTFPRPAENLSPDMKRRWRAFVAGVRKHERAHGTMAAQMARAAEKSMRTVTVPNDRGCRKTRREAKRRMTEIYAAYKKKQVRFDAREHREGGPVERLIDRLVQSGGV